MNRQIKLSRVKTCLFTVAASTSFSTAQAQDGPDEAPGNKPYLINPGDQLSIAVWKEPELARRAIVRPDGAFTFPLIGDVSTDGKSVMEITQTVRERLEKYIPEPVVTVAVEQIVGNDVYLIGQVARPGHFVLPTVIDVLQALSIAGGTTPFAQLDKIKILRRIDGQLITIPFNYSDIEKGKRLNQNITLEPGDVIIVP
jgi:polysaccharide export outer membrane protein